MVKICAISNKGPIMGGGYSNRTRATKFNPTGIVRKYPNLQKKKIFVPELGKSVKVLKILAIKPNHKSGKVISSGSK